MDLLFWIALGLIGVIAGFFAGILGVGGGFFIVPTLFWVLVWKRFSHSMALSQAIATSLCVMIFTASASAITHAIKGAVKWKLFFYIVIGVICGAFLGPWISHFISSSLLRTIIAILEIIVGLYLIFKLRPKDDSEGAKPIYSFFFFIPYALCAATISSLVGIGGGIFFVPAMIFLHHPTKNAIATSAMSIVPLAIISTLTYFWLAQKSGPTPFGQVVNVRAFIALSVTAIIASPIGATLCHKISDKALRISFGCVLIILGALFFL